MSSFNKVILMGNLTRDPETRYAQSGTAIVKFGLAVNRRYRDAEDNWVEEPVFVDVAGHPAGAVGDRFPDVHKQYVDVVGIDVSVAVVVAQRLRALLHRALVRDALQPCLDLVEEAFRLRADLQALACYRQAPPFGPRRSNTRAMPYAGLRLPQSGSWASALHMAPPIKRQRRGTLPAAILLT